jgi:Secretion system C-terminal sorting domain
VLLFNPGGLNFDTFWYDRFRLDGFLAVGTTDARPSALAHATLSPNPSQGLSTLDFSLTRAAQVDVVVQDLQGRVLQTPFAGRMGVGTHQVNLDASAYAPGVYLWTLQADGQQQSGKLVVLP